MTVAVKAQATLAGLGNAGLTEGEAIATARVEAIATAGVVATVGVEDEAAVAVIVAAQRVVRLQG